MAGLLEELLAQCAAGEPAAVAELVRRFRPWALDLAAALTGDPGHAEDAVQEAFLTALARLGDLRQAESFPAWFRQIVRTQCSRIVRRRREESRGDLPDSASNGLTPDGQAVAAELRQVVRHALAAIPVRDRDAAELFYLEERSCGEIAALLRVPTGTVKRRLHDARKRLRELLLDPAGKRPDL